MNLESEKANLFAQALSCYHANQFLEAEQLFSQVIEADAEHEAAYFYLARSCEQLNKIDEAIDFYMTASNLNPEYAKSNLAEVYYFLGLSLGKLEEYEQAISAFLKANELGMITPKLYRLLGDCYQYVNQFSNAVIAYKKSLLIGGDDATVYNNVGHALCACFKYEEAIESLNKALAINTNYGEAYNNLGIALMEKNEFAKAIPFFDTALRINPQHTKAEVVKSLALLCLGDFEMGWKLYESRPTANREQTFKFKQNWQSPSIKKILIETEQGYGDILQMLRYLPLIYKDGVEYYLKIANELTSLVKRSFPFVNIIAIDEDVIEADLSVKICSLPLVMNTYSEATIPNTTPYLSVDENKFIFWKKQLSGYNKPLVGLVWRGANRPSRMNRSISITQLESLLSLSEFQFVILQKEVTSFEKQELEKYNNVIVLDEKLIDFDETAAVMKNVDVMVSICSSPVHLAGALGIKTIALLPYSTDWRWQLNGSGSAWYPNTALIRQKVVGEWGDVIDQLVLQLKVVK